MYNEVKGKNAGYVVVLGDGASWIWNMANKVMPEAIQIIDYFHAKQYLWEAAEHMYGKESDLRSAWVKKQKERLFDDKVELVIGELKQYLLLGESLALRNFRSFAI